MPRRFFVAAAMLAVASACSPARAARSDLIPETTLARHGLARPWFAQVELDQGRANLRSVVLYEGVLYAQTDTAMVHAIDAETGKTLWSKQIGLPKHPSMPPDAKGDNLAIINGSSLYVVNRFTGDAVYEKEIRDAPGGGPALSAERAYVPIVTGLVIAYNVKSAADATGARGMTSTNSAGASHAQAEADQPRDDAAKKFVAPLYCQSFGRALVQPLVTRDDRSAEYVVWPTDRGYLNFGRLNREGDLSLMVKYRLETGATIVARPAYLPPNPKLLGDAGVVFAASCDGFLYAVSEETGDTLWRFSTGEPIVESPAVIDNRVYVTTQLGGLYCLDEKTGKSVWWADSVMRFVAASKTRVYATDSVGRLLVFSAASGAQLDAIPTQHISSILANSDTDRIYLISDGGLIQCLREEEQVAPLMHNKERKDAAKAGLTPPPEPKAKEHVVERHEHPAARPHATTPKPKPILNDKPLTRERLKKQPKQPKQPRNSKKKGGALDSGLDNNPANLFGPGVPLNGQGLRPQNGQRPGGNNLFPN